MCSFFFFFSFWSCIVRRWFPFLARYEVSTECFDKELSVFENYRGTNTRRILAEMLCPRASLGREEKEKEKREKILSRFEFRYLTRGCFSVAPHSRIFVLPFRVVPVQVLTLHSVEIMRRVAHFARRDFPRLTQLYQ